MTPREKRLTGAISLIELGLEFLYYDSLVKEVSREEYVECIKSLIASIITEFEQNYYYNENDDLVLPDYIDDLKSIMLNYSKIHR